MVVAGAAVDGCDVVTGGFPGMSPFLWSEAGGGRVRLTARPPAPPGSASVPATPGLHTLPTGPGPEVLLRVPSGTTTASPLVLTLHGAGGDARGGLAPLLPLADAYRLLLLSPRSQAAMEPGAVTRPSFYRRHPRRVGRVGGADRPGDLAGSECRTTAIVTGGAHLLRAAVDIHCLDVSLTDPLNGLRRWQVRGGARRRAFSGRADHRRPLG